MSKKLLLALTVIACILCCVIGLSACNDGGNETPNPYAISKTEWESTITPTTFEAKDNNGNKTVYSNGYSYMCYGNDYGEKAGTYIKQTNGNETIYKKYDVENNLLTSSAEEFNENIEDFVSLINYIRNNYELFTLEENETDGKYVISFGSKYTCNLETLKNECSAAQSLNITDLYLQRHMISSQNETDKLVRIHYQANGIDSSISFVPLVLTNVFKNAFDTLTNYTLKAGPSATDPDYAEYYLTENGFRMYTPNNADPNRRDGYYKYNSDTDNYTQYTKQADGSYITAQVSQNALDAVIAGVHDIYMYFETQKDSFYKTADGMKNNREITKTVGQRVHHYFDIDIKMDENGAVVSATWKYQMTQGEQQTQIYNMELTAGNTVIDFPNV